MGQQGRTDYTSEFSTNLNQETSQDTKERDRGWDPNTSLVPGEQPWPDTKSPRLTGKTPGTKVTED